ncbi:MAG: hypothetical protein GWP59_01420 [Chlamydiales bacterium]|nr:hypothetical protein [Chlamydiales bacterium]
MGDLDPTLGPGGIGHTRPPGGPEGSDSSASSRGVDSAGRTIEKLDAKDYSIKVEVLVDGKIENVTLQDKFAQAWLDMFAHTENMSKFEGSYKVDLMGNREVTASGDWEEGTPLLKAAQRTQAEAQKALNTLAYEGMEALALMQESSDGPGMDLETIKQNMRQTELLNQLKEGGDLETAKSDLKGVADKYREKVKTDRAGKKQVSREVENPLRAQLDETQQKLTEALARLEVAESRIEDAGGATLESLKEQLSALQKENEGLRAANEGLERTVASQGSELEELRPLRDEVKALKQELSELGKQRDTLLSEKVGLSDQVDSLTAEKTKLAENLEELTAELPSLKESGGGVATALREKIRELEEQLGAVTAERDTAKSSLEEKTVALEEAEGKISGFEEKVETQEAELEKLRPLEKKIEELEASLLKLTEEKETLASDNARLTEQVETLTSSKGELEQQLAGMINLKESLEVSLGELKGSGGEVAESLRSEIANLKEAIGDLTGERDAVKASLEEKTTALGEAEGKISGLEERQEELTRNLKSVRDERDAKVDRSDLDSSQAQVRELTEQLEAMRSRLEGLPEGETVADLNAKLEEVVTERSELQERLGDLGEGESVASLRKGMAQANRRYEELTSRLEGMVDSSSLSDLQDQLTAAEKKLAAAQTKVTKLEKDKEAIRLENTSLVGEVRGLKTDLEGRKEANKVMARKANKSTKLEEELAKAKRDAMVLEHKIRLAEEAQARAEADKVVTLGDLQKLQAEHQAQSERLATLESSTELATAETAARALAALGVRADKMLSIDDQFRLIEGVQKGRNALNKLSGLMINKLQQFGARSVDSDRCNFKTIITGLARTTKPKECLLGFETAAQQLANVKEFRTMMQDPELHEAFEELVATFGESVPPECATGVDFVRSLKRKSR